MIRLRDSSELITCAWPSTLPCVVAGIRTRGLVSLATRIVQEEVSLGYDPYRMTPVRHPHDLGVWLGDVSALQSLPFRWQTPW